MRIDVSHLELTVLYVKPQTRDQESLFFKKREFLFKMLFATLGANNTNRKLRYTQFWISWNYFKAKCNLHQGAEIFFFLQKKKRFYFHLNTVVLLFTSGHINSYLVVRIALLFQLRLMRD